MTLSIKNGGYAFLTRLDLMFSIKNCALYKKLTQKSPEYARFNLLETAGNQRSDIPQHKMY